MRRFMYRFIAVIVMITASVLMSGCTSKNQASGTLPYATLNPDKDFTLTDQEGRVFHLKDHRGEVVLLFFGYLTCPDICPTTLSKLARVYSLLGPEFKDKVLTLFVSVDPARDNPAKLKEYLSYFNINALGLTGTKPEIDKVVDAYKAMYQRVNTDSAVRYLFDHSDYVYMIDHKGQTQALFHPEDKAEKIADTIKLFSLQS